MNTKVTIAGVEFKNPVMTASGTFGSGMEYSDFVDLNKLGAVVTKGVANVPWPGNPTPRVAETYGGMLNAIGLQNPGIDVFIERDLAFLKNYDTKVIVNVCGKSVEDYIEVVEKLGDQDNVAMLEINVSCPNVKEGAIAFGQKADALMHITSEIKKKAKQPVIMKLSPNVTDITEMAKAAEAAGASAVAVHGRTREQYYSGKADYEIIRKVKEAVSIPVIGNGDVDSPEKAEALVKETGCDGIMIGRAVRGNPWIFREMNHYFTTGELLPRPSWDEIREMILRHARMQIELKGEFTGIREMRKHIAWYTSGMRHSAGLRRASNLVSSYEELEKLLDHELENR